MELIQVIAGELRKKRARLTAITEISFKGVEKALEAHLPARLSIYCPRTMRH